MRPVILVHGIWDSAQRIGPLARGLRARGVGPLAAIDLVPAWGSSRLERLATQLEAFVHATLQQHRAHTADLVGFSMGALVARVYLQELSGHRSIRTFVSLSGPQRGTYTAYALSVFAGVRQMRPGSALLRRLGDDVSGLPNVSVHCVYTPYDALIVPATSSILRGARSVHRVPVALHRWMLSDARVHDLVATLLQQGDSALDAGGAELTLGEADRPRYGSS